MSTSNDGQFELKVSPAEACIIDYSKSFKELVDFHNEQTRKIQEGDKTYLNGEFMQLGYAIDFIEFVQNIFKVTLDFDEAVIPTLEQILDGISQGVQEKKISPEVANDIMKKATGFFSVVIWKNIGGGFISSNVGYGVNVNGTNVFVYNRIGRRLQGDKNSDMISFYQSIKDLK